MSPEKIAEKIWRDYGQRITNSFDGFDVILKDDLEDIIKEAIELHEESKRTSNADT